MPEPGPLAGAPRGRRLAAWGIDATLMAGVAALLAVMTWGRLNGLLSDGLWTDALGSAGGLLLSGGDVRQAAEDFGVDLWVKVASAIEQALLLLVLAELLYQFAAQALAGRTLGKAALDLRVCAAHGGKPPKRRALRRALASTAGGTGLYCAAWILLLEGMFFLALLTWLAALAAFAANSLPALFGARRRTLADMVAGTSVVRADGYRRAAEAARQGIGVAWDGTQAAGQVAGQAVRGNAARLAQAEQVRRALESERARQVQEAGRRLGGRLRDAYGDRRAAREARRSELPPPYGPFAAIPPPRPDGDPYLPPLQTYRPYPPPPSPYTPPRPPDDGTG
ncbi:RDD family protein [Actinomadura graeca]|uniref:RDD family protein n=1 Tax=Actinomadura graeca TaxID=2750812 RepID=A0ABX8R5F0_9ACTN|nr:RDD family protein [Actinomadura graeca]QXJ26073.1 RDD family protein [Actinomadura graeca]